VVIFIRVVFLFIVLRVFLRIFLLNNGILIISIKVFNVGFFGDFELILSIWRFLFLIIVVLIRRSVAIFSFSYIRGLLVRNFIFLYIRFIVSILWLIINNNFYWIIFGWDGLGVVSFLLIVFYINHERINNGLFTIFQNRVGDLFFVLFMLGVVDFIITRRVVLKYGLVYLIFGGCVKRAQFPFNSWLLSAIRAPTPISSLVHSSTLVVAGVYILLQFSYCLYEILDVLKIISVLSLILRRFGLLNERDIKKLIAYSTISHVSLIMYLLRFKLYKVVYFHLNIHAIFKSLIFICFGFLILSSYHRQDKRLVSLVNINPIIKIRYYFSCLCLAGLPFLSGFFSKDFIIEKFIELNGEIFFVILLLLFFSISIYYSIKLINLNKYLFIYRSIEKSYLGMFRVTIIGGVIILLVNVYISLVFSLRLELLSFKIRIYFLIVIFFFLRVFTNLNMKFFNYDKIKNFSEVWSFNYYRVDKFIFYRLFSILQLIRVISNVKLFVLINWWVLIVVIVLF
jgi:NADH-ubiquinone oxidoreductase chain 5